MTQAPTPGPLSGDFFDEAKLYALRDQFQEINCTYDDGDNHISDLWAFSVAVAGLPNQTKGRIASGFYRVIESLGGMSDTLSIAGSYGDTLTDEQVADELEAWLAANPLRPQPSGETREAVARLTKDVATVKSFSANAATFYDGPNKRYIGDVAADIETVLALLSARPLALGDQQGEGAWVSVPVEPTNEMLDAVRPINGARVWSAMINALSTTPARPIALGGQQGEACSACFGARQVFMGVDCVHCRGSGYEPTPARAEAQDEGAALSASDRACYEYPGKDQSDLRAAFVAGACFIAAHPSPTPAADADRVRIAVEALELAFMSEVGLDLAHRVKEAEWSWPDNAPQTVTLLAEKLRKALAALKSEGK